MFNQSDTIAMQASSSTFRRRLFGPIPMFLCCIVLVVMLYFLDITSDFSTIADGRGSCHCTEDDGDCRLQVLDVQSNGHVAYHVDSNL
ncbi:hypothetical protein LIER_27434 [Lithospermum erythrorhizon]|uniref:Uncharacterized protein n=1 Tax=Lithospermum erythrorhizon TaxID=34254 RepID=A0AAV3RDQ0_LITER